MEDIDNWQAKFECCEYSAKLLNKLILLNEKATDPIDIREIIKAIYYAKKCHGSQMWQSGVPYYSHPIEVACMVAEYTAKEVHQLFKTDMIVIVNSGEFESRNDGAMPISNRRATSDDVTNFS